MFPCLYEFVISRAVLLWGLWFVLFVWHCWVLALEIDSLLLVEFLNDLLVDFFIKTDVFALLHVIVFLNLEDPFPFCIILPILVWGNPSLTQPFFPFYFFSLFLPFLLLSLPLLLPLLPLLLFLCLFKLHHGLFLMIDKPLFFLEKRDRFGWGSRGSLSFDSLLHRQGVTMQAFPLRMVAWLFLLIASFGSWSFELPVIH